MSINPLSADLDIVQSLVIPGLDDDLDIIQKLDDEPNDVGGLTAAELKAKFDAAGNTIKRYINEELLPAISDTVAEADARAAAEAQRQANETARVSAEQGRVTAESGRVSAENVRVSNETARQNAEQGRAAAEQGRVSAEQGRVSAEAVRVLAEQQRVDANTGIVAQATAQANAAGNSAAAASASAAAAGNSETAARAALLSIQSQTDGAVTLIADGDKPTVDLPCTANFGGVVTQDAGSLVPPGGTDGQVLGRSGGAAVWVDPSGGATPFWVTFTYADGECSADKTFAEIKAAHDAGDNCIGKVVEGPLTGYAPLSDITAIDATFCYAKTCVNITVTADGFVSTGRSYQLPLAGPGALGGVSPETADDAMTQSVGVDDDGRLWTAPGPQGPKGESGVHIGSTEPQDPDVMVWIDPTGGATWETLVNVTTTEDVSMIEYQFGDAYPRLEIITWLPLMSGNVTNNNNLVATINGVSWVNFIQDAASLYGRSTCRSEVVFAFGGVTVLSSSADRCKNIAAASSAPTGAESIKFNLATSGENDLIRAGTKILIRGAGAL